MVRHYTVLVVRILRGRCARRAHVARANWARRCSVVFEGVTRPTVTRPPPLCTAHTVTLPPVSAVAAASSAAAPAASASAPAGAPAGAPAPASAAPVAAAAGAAVAMQPVAPVVAAGFATLPARTCLYPRGKFDVEFNEASLVLRKADKDPAKRVAYVIERDSVEHVFAVSFKDKYKPDVRVVVVVFMVVLQVLTFTVVAWCVAFGCSTGCCCTLSFSTPTWRSANNPSGWWHLKKRVRSTLFFLFVDDCVSFLIVCAWTSHS